MPEVESAASGLSGIDTERALFLDFDGTLVDIAERPDAVALHPDLPEILSRLRDRLGGALAIISGRPVSFLDRRFAPFRFDAAGLHGIEYRIGDTFLPCRPDRHPHLRRMVERLKDALANHPGVLLEDKGCSAAIHWRLAPDEAGFARKLAQSAAEQLGPDYRIQFGKAVAEILPAASGKGRVIESFLSQPPYAGRQPVFIGDDLTDEHGFETVNVRGGLSVRVGEGATVARCRLGTPDEVRYCLSAWASGGPLSFSDQDIGA
jgi:trehalose 6-phosphate phosphatase